MFKVRAACAFSSCRGADWDIFKGTAWQSLDWKAVEINREEIETLFCAPKVSERTQVEVNKKPKDDKIRFFDSKRANNIGIMMSQFRGITTDGLVQALRDCDENVFSLERVTQLHKFCPSEGDTFDR